MQQNGEILAVPVHDHPDRSPSPGSTAARKLDIRPKKHRKAHAPLQVVFVGVAVRERSDLPDKGPEYAVSVSDGTGIVQGEHGFGEKGHSCERVLDSILELSKKYSKQRGHKIQILAVSPTCFGLTAPRSFDVPSLADGKQPYFLTRVWLELDAIPFLASKETSEGQFSLDAQASAAVDEALATLVPMSSSTIKIQLSGLRQLGSALAEQKTSVAFFSATPRGGGVALMRHSLMRIWHAADLDVRWFVPAGDPSVFNITKRKLHNCLQGVAEKDTRLKEEDKKLFEAWTKSNYQRFWSGEDSPFRRLDIAVIDDPQLMALIPRIRREWPRTKIIFRSHIQIRADLIDKGEEQICKTWDYLWGFISQADLFVSHPVEEFVPKVVKESMPVVYMPPSTDPLDGLNKPIKREFLHQYRHIFQNAVKSSSGSEVDWSRGVILQIARFDPSKGIPVLVEGYRLFRERVEKDGNELNHPPQLILTGHSSVDDPDGTVVLHKLLEQLENEKFRSIRDDIHAIRAPPSDRLLNAMLRGADVVCQVSTREGYEIKVSEAIHKGKFVIATKAGGIPLQVREGRDGTLVEPGDAEAIAKALLDFYSSDKHDDAKSEMTKNDVTDVKGGRFSDDDDGPSERDLSVGNATMWHLLWSRLMGISPHVHLSNEQEALLDRLGVSTDGEHAGSLEGIKGRKVWEVLVEGMAAEQKE
ncbi:hypothetical protein JCM10213_000304 [Rhodosporidiobolus nylandii]